MITAILIIMGFVVFMSLILNAKYFSHKGKAFYLFSKFNAIGQFKRYRIHASDKVMNYLRNLLNKEEMGNAGYIVAFAFFILITLVSLVLILVNFKDNAVGITLIFVEFFTFGPLFSMGKISEARDAAYQKFTDFEKKNKEYIKTWLRINDQEDYQKFKKLFFQDKANFKFVYFAKERDKYYESFNFEENIRPFVSNKVIDKKKILDFLICDYRFSEINNQSFPFAYYLGIMKELNI